MAKCPLGFALHFAVGSYLLPVVCSTKPNFKNSANESPWAVRVSAALSQFGNAQNDEASFVQAGLYCPSNVDCFIAD